MEEGEPFSRNRTCDKSQTGTQDLTRPWAVGTIVHASSLFMCTMLPFHDYDVGGKGCSPDQFDIACVKIGQLRPPHCTRQARPTRQAS